MLWRVMVRRGISRSVASGAISALPGADCGEAKTMQTLCGTLCGGPSAGTPFLRGFCGDTLSSRGNGWGHP